MRVVLALAFLVVACGSSKDEQVANCRVARAAYGDDLGACLVAKYNWGATDAAIARLMEERRVAILIDSLQRAAAQADSIRTAPARARAAARRVQVASWLGAFALCIDSLDTAADVRPCGRHLHDATFIEVNSYVERHRTTLTDPDYFRRAYDFLSIKFQN